MTEHTTIDPSPVIIVRRWNDSVIQTHGYDALGPYPERYWLPIIGPSALLILRRFTRDLQELEAQAATFNLDSIAKSMGLSFAKGYERSTFGRALNRLVRFNLAHWENDSTYLIRTMVPTVPYQLRRQRLSDLLQVTHDELMVAH